MPWYDGMLFEEIEEALVNRTAPGSDVPGGCVEVPNGYLRWMGNRLRASDEIAEGMRVGVTVGERRMSFAKAFRRLVFHLSKAEELASPTLREREQRQAAEKAVREARVRWETEHAPAVASLQETITRLTDEKTALERHAEILEAENQRLRDGIEKISEAQALLNKMALREMDSVAPVITKEETTALREVAISLTSRDRAALEHFSRGAAGRRLLHLYEKLNHATLQEGEANSRLPEASEDSSRKPPTSGSAGESG